MIDTLFERWAADNAGLNAALEAAGDDPFKQIDAYLRRSSARASFDPGRSTDHGCTFCDSRIGPRILVTIGRYVDGSPLTRPVCDRCMRLAKLRAMKPEATCTPR